MIAAEPHAMKPQMIHLRPIPDGGNPRSEADIRRTGDAFVIAPFSEDGDANYKFRLDVAVSNTSTEAVPVTFTIEWADSEYAKYRRYVLLSRDDMWERIPATLDDTRAVAHVTIPAGDSHLSMHPQYNYGRLEQLVASIRGSACDPRVIGKSLRGRNIYAIEAGHKDKRPLVIMTRAHPYESIGSFMVNGMIDWLNGGTAEALETLGRHRIVFLPMPNPDGVAEGTCKRTLGGLDINNAATSQEPEGLALAAYVRQIKPLATFDIHGFMHNSDGFATNDIKRGQAIGDRLLSRPDLFNKKLGVHESQDTEGGLSNLGAMAQHEFGSVRFGGSWTWFDRNATHLRAMGVEILRAYASQFQPGSG